MTQGMFTSLSSRIAKLVLLVCILTSSMALFAGTAMSIALPMIQAEFSASISQIQWALNAYTLMLGIFILLSGSVTDRISRRKVLLAGLLIFTLSSSLLALSKSIEIFISLRLIQGFGAALVIPQGLAIINTNFAASIRGWVIGLWGGLAGVVSVFSPVVSGGLVDLWGWQSIFWALVPFGIISLYLSWLVVKDQVQSDTSVYKLDWLGLGIMVVSLGLLSFGLIQGSEVGFDQVYILTTLVVGLVLLVVLVLVERHQPNPLLISACLRVRHVIGANLFTFFLYGVLSGIFVYIVMALIQVSGYSATQAGLLLMPTSVIITILTMFSGKLADKYGNRWPTVVGGLVTATGLFLLTFMDQDLNIYTELFPGLILIGLGFGLFIPSLTKAALDVPTSQSGFASGFNNAVARYAPLISIAIFSSIIFSSFGQHLEKALQASELDFEARQQIRSDANKLLAIELPESADRRQIREELNEGFLEGFRWAVVVSVGLVVFSSGIAVVTIDD